MGVETQSVPRLGMTFQIRRLNTLVEGRDHALLVAELDGELVGSVELSRENARCAGFIRLFVAPHVRKRGVGRALVEKCCQVALEESTCKTMGISVANDPDLCEFYYKLGFHFSYEFEDGSLSMCRILEDM